MFEMNYLIIPSSMLFTPKEEQTVILKRKGKYFLFVVAQL